MNGKAVDRRVRKTKQQLRRGLAELLCEKPVKDITVRELADKVDIHRGTFYLHYRDVFDMVEQIENEIFEGFSTTLENVPAQDINDAPSQMLESIFYFLSDNADMGAALLGANGDMAFVDKLKNLVKDKCLRDWITLFDTEKSSLFEPYSSFIVGGVVALMQLWLETGLAQSPHEMAVIAEQFIVEGVASLQKK